MNQYQRVSRLKKYLGDDVIKDAKEEKGKPFNIKEGISRLNYGGIWEKSKEFKDVTSSQTKLVLEKLKELVLHVFA